MLTHGHHLRNNGFAGPGDTKNFSQLFEVFGGSLSNGEHRVAQPAHAEGAKLFVKELNAELTGKEWDIFNDCETDSPLLVFGKLDDSGKEGL